MKHLSLAESLEMFQTLFGSAKSEMFKAEVLQDYTAVDDSPSLRAWLAGDKKKARTLGKTDANIIAYREQCLKSPAHITRVHIVQQPLAPYLEWEIAVCYQDSLLAHRAETILLAPFEAVANLQLPTGDFWIFDDKVVLQWEYENGTGKTTGARLWSEPLGDNIEPFRHLKKVFLQVAHPL
jgi:hypothetical protein